MLNAVLCYLKILGLCALLSASGCSTTPRNFVRTETIEVKVPVLQKVPEALTVPCEAHVLLEQGDKLTVEKLAAFAEDLSIALTVCNAQIDALRYFSLHGSLPLISGQ